MKPLNERNIEELIQSVAGGSDSDAQKSEPVLIARASMQSAEMMRQAMNRLADTVNGSAQSLQQTILVSTKALDKSLDKLDQQIQAFTYSSDKYSRRMFWLTIGLFSAAAVQAIATIVQIFKH